MKLHIHVINICTRELRMINMNSFARINEAANVATHIKQSKSEMQSNRIKICRLNCSSRMFVALALLNPLDS